MKQKPIAGPNIDHGKLYLAGQPGTWSIHSLVTIDKAKEPGWQRGYCALSGPIGIKKTTASITQVLPNKFCIINSLPVKLNAAGTEYEFVAGYSDKANLFELPAGFLENLVVQAEIDLDFAERQLAQRQQVLQVARELLKESK